MNKKTVFIKILVALKLLTTIYFAQASCVDLFKQLFVNPHLGQVQTLPSNFIGKRLRGYKNIVRQPLAPSFWKEDKAKMFLPEDTINHEAFIAPNGTLIRHDGSLLNTKGKSEGGRHAHSILLLTTDGRLLITDMDDQQYRHHHSSWGAWVRFAGEVDVVNGKVTFLNNKSGHFMTSKSRFAVFVELLIKNGVLLDNSVEVLVYMREYFYSATITELLE